MYFSPDKTQRQNFIKSYLNHYIYKWSRTETLLADKQAPALVSIVDPANFNYKFRGKGARELKKFNSSENIFIHRNHIDNIVSTIIPQGRQAKVMTLYCSLEDDVSATEDLINEAMELAKSEDYALVYDTFSKRLVPLMRSLGFTVAYQKQYLATQFFETVMIFNV
jgi:hypothetical protein